MKGFCFVLAFIFTLNSFAQLQELFEYEWYLRYVSINGQKYFPPSNGEVPFIPLNFVEPDSMFNTTVCNGASGEVTFDNSNYSFSFVDGIAVTLILCDIQENGLYEGLYFDFYLDDVTTPFEYVVGVVDPIGVYTLQIFSSSGDYAYYENYILSNQDITASNFVIYPNPTGNEIFISSLFEDSNFTVTIYDITGKIILAKKIKTSGKSINIQNLKSGIYFVSIKDKTGNNSIKRIIKK